MYAELYSLFTYHIIISVVVFIAYNSEYFYFRLVCSTIYQAKCFGGLGAKPPAKTFTLSQV